METSSKGSGQCMDEGGAVGLFNLENHGSKIMLIVAQEEECQPEDWGSCLSPCLWEVGVTTQQRFRIAHAEGVGEIMDWQCPRPSKDEWT